MHASTGSNGSYKLNDSNEVYSKSSVRYANSSASASASATLEIIIIFACAILSINIILYTLDMLTLYISIELFSFTSFFLILIKENKLSSMNAFIYFIFNTISSIIILLYFFIIYKNIGSLNFSTFHFFEGWASPVTSPVTSPVASPELINLFTNST